MEEKPQVDVYHEVLTAIVQRFVKLMGKSALKVARRVYGLQLDDAGNIISYRGDGMVIVQGLVIEYMTLLGSEAIPLSQRALVSTLERNPDINLPSLLKQ